MTESRKPRLLLYYPPGFDMRAWRAAFDEGRRAEASHWSLHLAGAHGFEVTSTEDGERRWLDRLVTKLTFRVLRFHLHHLWVNRHAVRDADIIWAMSERELIAAMLAVRLYRRAAPPAICGEIVWLLDEWSGYLSLRQRALRQLLRQADALIIYAQGDVRDLRATLPQAKVRKLPFAVPIAAFASTRRDRSQDRAADPDRPTRVLALGRDLRRDWATLFTALGDQPSVEITLLSNWPAVRAGAARHANVQAFDVSDFRALCEWYRWADVMVLPLKPGRHTAGLTVLLEAVAAGVPVIVSRIAHIDEYFPEDCVTYVPPADAPALREAVARVAADPAASLAAASRAIKVAAERGYDAPVAVARRCTIFREALAARAGLLGSGLRRERRRASPPGAEPRVLGPRMGSLERLGSPTQT